MTARRDQVWLPNSQLKETRAACRARRDVSVTKRLDWGLRRLEVVGRHAVEEFLELLDLVLTDRARRFLVVLVGNQQASLGEHRFLDINRHADAQRDGHRVRRPRRHLDVAVEDQIRVEGALLEVDDAYLLERMTKCGNEISDQVVRQWPRGLVALLFERDGRGLRLADPDRQVAVTVGFP